MPIYAVDLSNHNGSLSTDWFSAFKDLGGDHVVARLGLERESFRDIARQQLQNALEAGCTISGYIWMYTTESPESTAEQALDWYGDLPLKIWWVDAEETHYVGSVDENVDWLHRCFGVLRNNGRRVGTYTGLWWWRPYMGNSSEFIDVPLWAAQYDGNPNLQVWAPFGGWSTLAGKQYSANGTINGVGPLDLDVFDDALFTEDDLSQEERDELGFLRSWYSLVRTDYVAKIRAEVDLARKAARKAARNEHLTEIENVANTIERGE